MPKKTLILLSLALVCGCSRHGPGSDSTNIRDNIQGAWTSGNEYRNPFFAVGIKVPEDWVLKKGLSEQLSNKAVDLLAGDEKNLRSVMKSAIEKTYTVFWAYRYPLGTPGKTNPNMSMMIENVALYPGIVSASDYLKAMEQTLKLSKLDARFVSDPADAVLGNAHFTMREIEVPLGTMRLREKFYCMFKDGYVLTIEVTIMTQADEEQTNLITSTVHTLP